MSDPHEDKQLEKLAELWRKERETCRRRHLEERAETTLDERVEQGIALANLEVEETAAAPGERMMLWLAPRKPDALDGFRAGPGSPVVLWRESPTERDAVQAVIARRKGGRLGVMVDGDVPDRLFGDTFHLDQEAPQTTFDRGERAVAAFRQAAKVSDQGQLRKVLFGAHEPKRRRSPEWSVFDEELNEAQRRAVEQALSAEDVALVHGPPGTGKTRTLVEVVRQAVARGERVLVTAASNAAVDNLAERLIEAGVEVVRLGHPARVAPSVEARSLDALLEATHDYKLAQKWMDEAREIRRRIDARSSRGKSSRGSLSRAERAGMYREMRNLWGDARGHLRRVQGAIIDRTPVICATAAGADSKLLDDEEFDLVVLDEATQAADPIALVALLRAPKVVMAGDPHQLAPTVIDLEAEREGLGVTLFERLSDEAVMLEVQHRMHECLMTFPSETKYDGQLVAADAVVEHTLDELDGVVADPVRTGPLVFVDTAGKGWDEERSEEDPSSSNPAQAERTAAEVRRLVSRCVSPDDIAVISPYFAQVRRLRKLLDDVPGVEIDTVDGFQGREKEAVVVDLVRSNPDGQLGFLKDTRRMNVALTRARRFLLVIGDSATLSTHPYYAAFLEAVEQRGTWVSAWADEAEPL
ncbi:AAA family ATPase [Persicimonas caeni]|uniref:AAA family ATPase n=1 Tax=Persicimonas caeni TaxID=2292766 RepID=A0A4Y6PMB6_PERCE|nr:AAA domain-containing protein [Persicimonas caeni]QDG49456.1 AAA family ATPase [Persicimonas caeni]QED30677.1 AAA family ATPase [Persicimonas caeni]